MSRTEISKELDIGLPTTMRIVDALVERRFLSDVGVGNSTGGRPPTIVDIDRSSLKVVGIEIGRRTTRAVLTNLLGKAVYGQTTDIRRVDTPEKLLSFTSDFLSAAAVPKTDILGIGIAAPGPLDPKQGRILQPYKFPVALQNVPLADVVSKHFQLRCCLTNNADAAALSEVWSHTADSPDSLIFVLGELGFGMGTVLHGQVWNGHSNVSGELSHIVVNRHGRKCSCGKVGCVDAYSSLSVMEQRVSEKLQEDIPFEEIISRAERGADPEGSVVREALEVLETGILNAAAVVDPQSIVLGGKFWIDIEQYAPGLFSGTVNALSEWAGASVSMTRRGIQAVSLGAATLVLQDVYDHTNAVK
ncbi:ROK family protein [Alicyclobacillus sp. SO9]|uniref:ROK family protein n=1 Tax=Alicyclobacillus sp. SO9 TaxID=2665646 RepID=UPI0018E8B031|nr:ROK family protein [Alicyclobacillus sp. SO9]QQE80518.1 ROK family protein [Alicyclobacillus sp. SO9]